MAKPKKRKRGRKRQVRTFRKGRVRELTLTHLEELVRLQLPLGEGLRRAAEESSIISFRKVASSIAEDLDRGEPLYAAISRHPRVFPKSDVELIRSGEDVGLLDTPLKQLIEYIQNAREFNGRFRNALIYFGGVQMFTLFIASSLLVFVVPQFAQIFNSMGPSTLLPPETRSLIAVSNFVRNPIFFFGGIFVVWFLWRWVPWLVSRTPLPRLWQGIGQRVPLIYALYVKHPMANAAMVMSTMLRAGVPIEIILEDLSLLTIDRKFREAFSRVYHRVVQGEELSGAFNEEQGVLPPEFLAAILVGISGNNLPANLDYVASAYRQDSIRASQVLTEVVSPFFVVITGVIVYVFYRALFAPILGLSTIL